MEMTGKERMEAALRGEKPDLCPAAPVFWGAEYVWKVTGRDLLHQMHGRDPGYPEAALRLAARHHADWILLTVTDGDGWLEGKELSSREGLIRIHDPKTGEEFVFDSDGHLVRAAGGPPETIPAQGTSSVATRDEVNRLFPDSRDGHPDHHLNRVAEVVAKCGAETFVCACEISPFVDVCYRLGCQTAMRKLIDDPALFLYAADLSLGIQQARIHSLRRTGVHGVLIAESYASCDMISPDHYRRFAFPYQMQMVKTVQDCGIFALIYSSGNLIPILGDMAKLGADGLIIEEDRKGSRMDVAEVRRLYGEGRCFFGNVSAERLLAPGDMPGIYRETIRQIEAAGKDGAFVASNGASPVCDATLPVAVDVLVEAAHSYRY